MRVEDVKDIELLKTSKYVQARKGDIFKSIRNDLDLGKKVLFIGTPCEVYAVNRYISNKMNLYSVSLICHGPTSLKVHQAFCSYLEDKYNSAITKFSVRYKRDGHWKPYYIFAAFENGESYMK